MCNIAQKALDRLKDMPQTSYKWTWGETLTQDDILDLSSGPSHWVHSRYQASLRDGQIQGIPSSTNTAPTGLADYSILYPDSHIPLPPTSQCFPDFFWRYKSSSPSLPSIQTLHISVPTSHHPDSAHIDDSAHVDDSGHLANSAHSGNLGHSADSGHCADSVMSTVDLCARKSPKRTVLPHCNIITT